MKTLITDRTLRGLKPAPTGKRTVIWDTAVPSLCVRVTDKGAASFSIMRRLRGQLIRRTIGIGWHVPFPAGQPLPFPLAEARQAARAMLLDIAHGVDPKAKQEAEREADARATQDTFAAIAEEFLAKHVAKLRSRRDVEAAFRRELIPVLGKKPVTAITRRDIIRILEAVAESGRPYIARHLKAYLSKFFTWAIARDCYGLGASPCTGIRAADIVGQTKPRQRVLTDSELKALWQATAALSYPAGPFVRLLLLTGQRLRKVGHMAWREVDVEKRLWTIPGSRMKADAPHVVPLSPAVIAILELLPRWTGDYVFSGKDGKRPISWFSVIKDRVDLLMPGVADWRFHDLRRTMRTGLSALRVSDIVAELCIGHTQKGLHKTYDQHAYLDEKRHAFDAWVARLLSIVDPGDADNVVSFSKNRG